MDIYIFKIDFKELYILIGTINDFQFYILYQEFHKSSQF